MKAYLIEVPDGPFRKTDLPTPRPADREVLIRVNASGVNPLDTKIRAGQAAHAKQPLPAVLGMDMAGIVEAIGPGVTAFRPGDEVFGMVGGVGGLQGRWRSSSSRMRSCSPLSPRHSRCVRLRHFRSSRSPLGKV